MTSWSAIRHGFDAFTRHLPVLMGAWLVILAVQQAASLLIPDSLVALHALVAFFLLGPLYAGQYILALHAVRQERCTLSMLFLGFHRYAAVLLAYILVSLVTLLGLFALIIPGIIIGIAFSFTPLCLLDDHRELPLSATEAMSESSRSTKGYRGTIFGIGLLLSIPYAILSALLVVHAINPTFPPWVLEVAALLSGTLFLGPVQTTSLAVVYEHARRQRLLQSM